MSEKNPKDITKSKVAVIGIGLIIGIALLLFGGETPKEEKSESAEDYRAAIEASLERICQSAAGGEVRVFVSIDEGYSYVYADDGRGGVVSVGSGSNEYALVERVFMPKISGVGAVYFGTKDLALESKLTELISSSLGIGKNKIFIIESKNSKLHS